MKKKIFALCFAAVLGAMSAFALAACGDKPEPHACGHVCQVTGCGKCTSDCTDPVCADKCEGHEPHAPQHECKSVCPEENCGKCTSDCTDPVCADKCEGHEPPAPQHECKSVCPEENCGKCTSDCTDPACADKCEGHEPPVEYEVTFDVNGGSGEVTGMRYAAGEKFNLPDGSGLEKGVCTLVGWNDGTSDYAVGSEYVMPETAVRFTAVWQAASYTFDIVNNSAVRDNVILKQGTGGFIFNSDHIGGVAQNWNATMVFDVSADVAGRAELLFTVCDRLGTFTFDDAYSLSVNGVKVPSSADMSKGGTDWENYESYKIAALNLVKGKNTVAITVVNTNPDGLAEGYPDLAGNVRGITLTSETVTCTPYDYHEDSWSNAAEFSAQSDGSLTVGVTSNGSVSSSENCIGAMEYENNFVAFEAVSDTSVKAAVYVKVCHRPHWEFLSEAFDVYVNEEKVISYSLMPRGGTQWSDYDYVKLGIVDMTANRPVRIAFVSKGGDSSAYNVRGLKIATESEAAVSLTTSDMFAYAAGWNNTDIAFVTESGGNKTIVSGINVGHETDGENPRIDSGSASLGNLSSNVGATVSFTVNATEATRAVILMDACVRGGNEWYFFEAFELKVNGKSVFSCSAMPKDGTEWTEFFKTALAEIELKEGGNEISFTVVSSKGWVGCNVAGMSFKCENGSVTLEA